MYQRHKDGTAGEKLALRFLKRQGLKLVERNFRTRLGEIDLIMMDGEYLVFIEVRYRGDDSKVSALESITPRKQARIRQAAAMWLRHNCAGLEPDCRFDAVGIDGPLEGAALNWIRNAF